MIAYNLYFFFLLFLVLLHREVKQKSLVSLIIFISLITFNGLRFFVGNDYGGYVNYFDNIKLGYSPLVEPGFYFINRIFLNFNEGYVFVILIYSVISYFLIFKIIKKYDLGISSVLFITLSDFQFLLNDQIRQGLAILIFFYSIKYIKEKNVVKYILLLSFGSIFVHFSLIFTIPLYFLSSIKIHKYLAVIILILVYLFYRFGFFQSLISYLEFIPIYGEHYASRSKFLKEEELGTGLGVLFSLVISVFLILKSDLIKNELILNLYILGSIFYFLTLDFHLFNRITYYIFYLKFILYSIYVKNEKSIFFRFGFILVLFVYFQSTLIKGGGKHGGLPYRTIFNLEQKEIFENEYYLEKR